MFYNAIGNCPCKNTCEMREINCHSKCNAYLDWSKKQEEFREKIRAKKKLDYFLNYSSYKTECRKKYIKRK